MIMSKMFPHRLNGLSLSYFFSSNKFFFSFLFFGKKDVNYQVNLAFTSMNEGVSLWRAEAVKEMCEMDQRIVLSSPYVSKFNGETCPSHSIGYYIGLLHNKECEDITDDDMNTTLQVIKIF